MNVSHETSVNLATVADLALELVSSAFGRGQDDAGPDDRRIDVEARAIDAIRRGDVKAIERSLAKLRKQHTEEWAELERQFGVDRE